MTYGEEFKSAMKCETPEQAQHWLQAQIELRGIKFGQSGGDAKEIILANLGYMAGTAERGRATTVQGTSNPFFRRNSRYSLPQSCGPTCLYWGISSRSGT